MPTQLFGRNIFAYLNHRFPLLFLLGIFSDRSYSCMLVPRTILMQIKEHTNMLFFCDFEMIRQTIF